jgi:hypothetical protein
LPERTIPQRLLQRLDDLAVAARERGGVFAVLGLGSVGTDLARLDDHSDLDFFVIVDDGTETRLRTSSRPARTSVHASCGAGTTPLTGSSTRDVHCRPLRT